MVIELEFDPVLEVRFFFSTLPSSLMETLGQQRQALFDSTGPFHNYGATGTCELEASGKRFLVFVRLGGAHRGEGGEAVHVVRVLHVIENTASGA